MFTGLVQQVGVLRRLVRTGGGWSLEISHEPWPDRLVPGESVAVQGACLSVTEESEGFFRADVLDETLRRTALQKLGAASRVNLERALAVGDRLGGHIVGGHVDEQGVLNGIEPRSRDVAWRIGCSRGLARLMVMKGSVAVDGVSLTISGLGDDWFEINLIPHTLSITSLGDRKIGDPLNLEGDMLGKYVARILGKGNHSEITDAMLSENGFV